jgi:hypothetical protein
MLGQLPPQLVEASFAVQQRNLRSHIVAERFTGPPVNLLEYRITRGLRRHPHEQPIQAETSSQDLRRGKRRLRLALPHRRFDNHQAGRVQLASEINHQTLRLTRRIPEPRRDRFSGRNRDPPPTSAQSQCRPSGRSAAPARTDANLLERIQTTKVMLVARNPVSHHDQA